MIRTELEARARLGEFKAKWAGTIYKDSKVVHGFKRLLGTHRKYISYCNLERFDSELRFDKRPNDRFCVRCLKGIEIRLREGRPL